jgi:hypothetical protein
MILLKSPAHALASLGGTGGRAVKVEHTRRITCTPEIAQKRCKKKQLQYKGTHSRLFSTLQSSKKIPFLS